MSKTYHGRPVDTTRCFFSFKNVFTFVVAVIAVVC